MTCLGSGMLAPPVPYRPCHGQRDGSERCRERVYLVGRRQIATMLLPTAKMYYTGVKFVAPDCMNIPFRIDRPRRVAPFGPAACYSENRFNVRADDSMHFRCIQLIKRGKHIFTARE